MFVEAGDIKGLRKALLVVTFKNLLWAKKENHKNAIMYYYSNWNQAKDVTSPVKMLPAQQYKLFD